MALPADMFLLIFASVLFVTICEGNKEQKLEHLIKDVKGESDNIANEIYAWIHKHSKELQSHDHARHQARHHIKSSGLTKTEEKENVEEVIKTLKGESDHLANEIYAWIGKHKKSFLSRGHKDALIDKHQKGFLSHDKSRGHGHARHHSRNRRSIKRRNTDDGNGVEGESIQDVMKDLMNAPRPKVKRHNKKKESKKVKKSLKRKVIKKSKHLENKKNRIQKHVKPVSPLRKSKILKKKKTSSAHVIKAVKKSGGLADLLKVISADPSKKIVVTKGKKDVTLDSKSLNFFKRIPKSILQKLIENVELNKYFNIDTYISGEQPGKTGKGIVAKKKNNLKKVSKKNHGKPVALRKHDEKGTGSAMESSAEEEKEENKLKMKVKKLSKKGKKKSIIESKKAKVKISNKGIKKSKLRKAKKKDERAVSKSKVIPHEKSRKKGPFNYKKKQRVLGKDKTRQASAEIGHQKLAELKDKIKKTNTLKFKVAKALLEHCETQNKLKKVFDNVNASLKEASHLAKAIGKKFGIKKSDLDKLTTKHQEEAVQEFLNKIF